MSPELDAALTTTAWCVTLYFALLVTEAALRMYAQIHAIFKRREEREVDIKFTREYIDAMNKLAESRKIDDNGEPR